MFETHVEPDRALLVQAIIGGEDADRAARLAEELHHLAEGAGLIPASSALFPLKQIHPGLYFGQGRVQELADEVAELNIDVVVVNHALSPVQQRNLENAFKAKVVDRTGLILEIFAARARTKEGRMQVELASLMYQQSRLVRTWTHLERQRGGVGLRGGPGETQIEVDRRLIRKRIDRLKLDLKDVERTRALQRKPRRDAPLFTAALVGYTNAGKSTLFNKLAGSQVYAQDQLFATLDPTVRVVQLPNGGRMALSDTVGFVRELPHQLVAAFRATLEEVLEADLLLHVVDLSDPEWAEQQQAVMDVLEELNAHQKPQMILYNKVDALEREDPLIERVGRRERCLPISAISGAGLDHLFDALQTEIASGWRDYLVRLPAHCGSILAKLHRDGEVRAIEEDGADLRVTVSLSEAEHGRLLEAIKRENTAVSVRDLT
ncbi:GTPase HflX [Magnetofaba australis]|uniref:GTPase HflX n=1 Tax=Magnetofaba australis IT-1 TaxID=1434232 RepID=A0A1Y2K0B9_9PROT|nr:GTPase HflX [Magnetofaba australis]OSM01470.1 putative HSR1-like GTP-binding protein [Magnetofaba australis IT-1]